MRPVNPTAMPRDRAQADAASAEASVKKAEAEMKVIQSDLDKSEIKSGITGIE